jgi:predicted nucleotidyltransferase
MDVRNIGLRGIAQTVPEVLSIFDYKDRVKRVGVFGSVARGEAAAGSDIDLVIDYKYAAAKNMTAEVRKWFEFENLLRRQFSPAELSIINLKALADNGDIEFKSDIERDVVWVYEQK